MEIRFKLNPDNPKDAKIIELLNKEYASSGQYIKSVLYAIATNNNSLLLHKSGVKVENTPQKWSETYAENSKILHKSGVEGEETPKHSTFVESEWSKYFND